MIGVGIICFIAGAAFGIMLACLMAVSRINEYSSKYDALEQKYEHLRENTEKTEPVSTAE